MTLRELIFDLKNTLRGGRQSDDDPISDREVYHQIKTVRATLLKRAIDSKTSVTNSIQEINCMPMVFTDKSECCEIKTDCPIIRTAHQIPNVIHEQDSIRYFGLIDKQRHISLQEYTVAKYYHYKRWGKDQPFAYFLNNYIYVVNMPHLEFTTILGLFEHPEEVLKLNKCANGDCIDLTDLFTFWDNIYPLDDYLLMELKRLLLLEQMRIMALSKTDTTNDAKSDAITV